MKVKSLSDYFSVCDDPLGMEGKFEGAVTSSDVKGWPPQVNLGVSSMVTGIQLQAGSASTLMYVERYQVQFGDDGETWQYVEKDENEDENEDGVVRS